MLFGESVRWLGRGFRRPRLQGHLSFPGLPLQRAIASWRHPLHREKVQRSPKDGLRSPLERRGRLVSGHADDEPAKDLALKIGLCGAVTRQSLYEQVK